MAANSATRAERRRGAPAPAPEAARIPWRGLTRASRVLWAVATLVFLVLVLRGVERKITWYLAVDQFGYLTFAEDLLRGRVFHQWPPIAAIRHRIPSPTDVLSQTYVFDHGRLHSRYAPGFPILLAAWMGVLGRNAAHYLNFTVFAGVLLLVLGFAWRVFRSRWRATAAMALLVLCPTFIHLWALTPTRDLAAHAAGFAGVFLLLPARGRALGPARAAGAAAAIGFAASIRPDAILYAVPALCLAAARLWREGAAWRALVRTTAAAAGALLIGLAPFLAFNWAATGNPLRPTQAMELRNFLPADPPAAPGAGYPSGAWRGGTLHAVQGGGLSIGNLPTVLPGNVRLLGAAYGVLLPLALWGAALALVQRRALFLTAVPYTAVALLFFSCWTRPDARYLSGIYLFVPLLVLEGAVGTLDLVRRLARGGRGGVARALALAAAAGMTAAAARSDPSAAMSALPVVALVVPLVGAAAALAAGAWPTRRVAAVAAPVLALALTGYGTARALAADPRRATFQRPQMERARAKVRAAVEPGAVIITTEEVGRPAENIEYYSGVAHALYLTDLERWRISVGDFANRLLFDGMKPYLLIPTMLRNRTRLIGELQQRFTVELAADIPGREAIEYFVAAAFHRGVHMELWRITPPRG